MTMAHEVEAHPAHAAAIERFEIGIAEAVVHDGDPAITIRHQGAMASSIARLSVPWQLACTITA